MPLPKGKNRKFIINGKEPKSSINVGKLWRDDPEASRKFQKGQQKFKKPVKIQ